VAYEPVWAIGTGRNATPEMAQEVHASSGRCWAGSSAHRKRQDQDPLRRSVKPDNVDGLMAQKDIDGVLGRCEPGGAPFERIIRYRDKTVRYNFILAIHIIVCIGLIVAVLLQAGKGADIGAVFGGAGGQACSEARAGGLHQEGHARDGSGVLAHLAHPGLLQPRKAEHKRHVKGPVAAQPAPPAPAIHRAQCRHREVTVEKSVIYRRGL
jgi:hypothetical protein